MEFIPNLTGLNLADAKETVFWDTVEPLRTACVITTYGRNPLIKVRPRNIPLFIIAVNNTPKGEFRGFSACVLGSIDAVINGTFSVNGIDTQVECGNDVFIAGIGIPFFYLFVEKVPGTINTILTKGIINLDIHELPDGIVPFVFNVYERSIIMNGVA